MSKKKTSKIKTKITNKKIDEIIDYELKNLKVSKKKTTKPNIIINNDNNETKKNRIKKSNNNEI